MASKVRDTSNHPWNNVDPPPCFDDHDLPFGTLPEANTRLRMVTILPSAAVERLMTLIPLILPASRGGKQIVPFVVILYKES